MTILSLEDRFARRLKSQSSLPRQGTADDFDKGVASFAKEILNEARLDGCDAASIGLQATVLLELLSGTQELPQTKRVLHDAIFAAWVAADTGSAVEQELASTILRQPHFFGPSSPTVEQWKETVTRALGKSSKRQILSLLSSATPQSNEILIRECVARLGEILDLDHTLFMISCLRNLGENPNTLKLVSWKSLGHIRRMSELAEYSFSLGLHLIHLRERGVELSLPNVVSILYTVAACPTGKENLNSVERRHAEEQRTLELALREGWWPSVKHKMDLTVKLIARIEVGGKRKALVHEISFSRH